MTLTESRRQMKVETHETYVYDPAKVQALYEQLRPDPDQYGDDPAWAVFEYLYGSQFHADVFESNSEGGMWPIEDEVYDPEA